MTEAYWFPKWLYQFTFSPIGYWGSLTPNQHLLFVDFSVIATLVQKIYMHSNVHSSIIYSGQGLEAPKFSSTAEWIKKMYIYIYCWCSVTKLCSTFCNPMDCSTPGLPAPPHLSEFAHSCPLNWWCHTNIHTMLCVCVCVCVCVYTYTMEY